MFKVQSTLYLLSETIGYNYEFNNSLEIAEDWLIKNGFNIIGHAEGKGHYYVITDTFISPKK